MQEVPSEHQEALDCEGDQAVAQFAQRGYEVSITEEIQKSGHGFGQAALGGPAHGGG